MNNLEPCISPELIPEVFALASRLQAEHDQTYSLPDLIKIGTEANIAPEFIQQAVQQIQAQQQHICDRRRKLKIGMITTGAALTLWSIWSGTIPLAQGHCSSMMGRTQQTTSEYGG